MDNGDIPEPSQMIRMIQDALVQNRHLACAFIDPWRDSSAKSLGGASAAASAADFATSGLKNAEKSNEEWGNSQDVPRKWTEEQVCTLEDVSRVQKREAESSSFGTIQVHLQGAFTDPWKSRVPVLLSLSSSYFAGTSSWDEQLSGWGGTEQAEEDCGWGDAMERNASQQLGSCSSVVKKRKAESLDENMREMRTGTKQKVYGGFSAAPNLVETHLQGAFCDPWRNCLPVLMSAPLTSFPSAAGTSVSPAPAPAPGWDAPAAGWDAPAPYGEDSGWGDPDTKQVEEHDWGEIKERTPEESPGAWGDGWGGVNRKRKFPSLSNTAKKPKVAPGSVWDQASNATDMLRGWLDTMPEELDGWGNSVQESNHVDPPLLEGGLIFECNKETWKICKKLHLFGLGAEHAKQVLRVVPGTRLFLFNSETHNVIGVFEATSKGGLDIVPDAFLPFGHYPAQVRVKRILKFPSLPVSLLKNTLPDNFNGGASLSFPLTPSQVEKLIILFKISEAIFFS